MKEGIFEGLKNALSKGESLQIAMQSFYNAGYDVKDIQEAARELQSKMLQHSPKFNSAGFQTKQSKYAEEKVPPPSVQNVSNYEQVQTNPRKIIVIIILILLVMLVFALGGIFLFRERILDFFSDLFVQLR